ncbi:lysophospholipid acyltransferase LPEAT2 [Senna tora]|uniref:Lysophospholipid acyltransferase LPEAT2 n=1 Tax=Senna tora TaxID=362788 RepID=A0A834WK68_9FABA|nr:lysophospholipid acyltransferase LPEAT2 [Senna tora]
MADHGITAPLLSSQSSNQVVLTLSDDDSDRPSAQSCAGNDNPQFPHPYQSNSGETLVESDNPFRLLGCEDLYVSPPATVNPFLNDTPNVDGLYEWLKIVVCLPIALVRLVIFGLSMLIGYLATKLALEGWKDKKNPMPRWRWRLMWVTRMCARFILLAFGYQWIKRKGKPAPRETAPIIVSNHISYIEPIFYFYELFPTIVASESHDSIPCVGTIIRAMQVIYVNRFSAESRKDVVKEIKEIVTDFVIYRIEIRARRASCDRFPRVLLFPEGTTTNGRNLISFQLGAFLPGYPIQPVIVRYPHVHFDQSWGNVSLAKLMFRMFTQFHNFFEVEYLPVISPLDDKKETASQFADRTSRAIATSLNTVQTGHAYGDLMLYMKALEAKQENPTSFMVEIANMDSAFRVGSKEALEFLDRFLSMNPDPSGCVQYHDFLRVLGLKACPLSEAIFSFIDVEKSGIITFRQFLYKSSQVMKQPLFNQACESAFAECGNGLKGYLVEHELLNFLRTAIPGWKENEVHELFVLFDTDKDGRVSKDDFLSCLKKNPLLIALFIPHLQHKNLLGDAVPLEEIV